MPSFGIINKKNYFRPRVYLMLKMNIDFKSGMKWIKTPKKWKKNKTSTICTPFVKYWLYTTPVISITILIWLLTVAYKFLFPEGWYLMKTITFELLKKKLEYNSMYPKITFFKMMKYLVWNIYQNVCMRSWIHKHVHESCPVDTR